MKKQKGTYMLTNSETGHLASCDIQISKRENFFLLIHDMDLVGDLWYLIPNGLRDESSS